MSLLNGIRVRSVVVAMAGAMALPFVSAGVMGTAPLLAQRVVGSQPGTPFKDTSMFKPPAGVRVAVIEFQDMQCPACAHAFPIVHEAVAHYKIPLYEKDFPLQMHALEGSFDAAVWARYLQDKVSLKVADEYRGAVFAGQAGIQNKDDMAAFTRRFFQSHGMQMPFVADPTGQFTKEVVADRTLGEKAGLNHTPTIIVSNQHEWVEVSDVSQLYTAIDQIEASAGVAAPAAKTATKKKSVGTAHSAAH
ncbi:MAG TPA: thioredoxin domain-containing protein [Acidobacteriaceae bacterium]|nr:thioredoxin domain-containing protein [Acidobacteriaceae bacterium]